MIQNYDCIFFDADETLFHFDAFRGLQRTFAQLNVAFTEHDYQEYQIVNKPLWTHYQLGKIDAKTVQEQRFDLWSRRLNIPSYELNTAFLNAMADICEPLPGATLLLNKLKGNVKLGIITNGFAHMQQLRLERTGLKDHFDALVISEKTGVAKPALAIFDYALSLMNHPPRERVLMVGDTLESDILGGINAGLHTCWLNPQQKLLPKHIKPHFQVASLSALDALLHPSS